MENEAQAKRYLTSDGVLDIVFYANTANMNGKTGDYTIRETKADVIYRERVDDTHYTFTAGEVLDLTADKTKDLKDGTGLALDLTLIGHKKENITEENKGDVIPGVTFELYLVESGEDPKLVTTYDQNGNAVSNTVTKADGTGYFYYLDKLTDGQSYVLV